MNSRRLPWLLVLLGALLLLRWLVPPGSSAFYEVAQAVPRASPPAQPRPASSVPPQVGSPRSIAKRVSDEPDRPGNAFRVRIPKPPPLPVVAIQSVPPVPSRPLPPPAPPAAPPAVPAAPVQAAAPFRVIGTWDDGAAPGVFIVGPHGTLLARQGNTLLAEYTVTAITRQHVSLLHLESKREMQLPIPQVPLTAPRP